MVGNSEKEHVKIKPRWRDQWERDWPADYLRAYLTEQLIAEDDLEGYGCLPIIKRLGYDPEALYVNLTYDIEDFEPTYEWFRGDIKSLEVDVAAARFPEQSPHLVIKSHRWLKEKQNMDEYVGHRNQRIGIDQNVALDYLRASGAEYSILLSNVYIIIARKEGAPWLDEHDDRRTIAKRLTEVDWEFANQLKKILQQPDRLAVSTTTDKTQSNLEEWAYSDTVEDK